MLQPEEVTAVVLAGGFGTRIKHLLHDLPKPMAPVLGRPFVEWVVRYLAKQNVHEVILSTGHLAETVARHFKSQPVKGVNVECVPEPAPLGTAGGFLNAAQAANKHPSAWLVMNGDSLALAPVRAMLEMASNSTIDGAILGIPVDDAARFGTIVKNDKAELISFKEKCPGAGVINAGQYIFKAFTLKEFPAKRPLSFESDVFPEFLAQGRKLGVCVTGADFLDIGTPESLPLAGAFIQNHAKWFAQN